MTAINLSAIENMARSYDGGGQLYWTIHQLVSNSREADTICRDFQISKIGTPQADRQLLRDRFGSCMDSGLLTSMCRRRVPLVVGSLALIGLWQCSFNRNANGGKPPATSADVPANEASVQRTSVLGLVIEARKIGAYQPNTELTTPDVLQLLSIATFFRCMSPETSKNVFIETEFHDSISTDDVELLVFLEIKPGGNLIDVQSRYELRDRIQDYRRTISIVRQGAIGNSLGLKGFAQ